MKWVIYTLMIGASIHSPISAQENSISTADSLFKLAKERYWANDYKSASNYFSMSAEVYYNLGDTVSAIISELEGIDLMQNMDSVKIRLDVIGYEVALYDDHDLNYRYNKSLGLYNFEVGEIHESKRFYKKAHTYAIATQDSNLIASSYSNLAFSGYYLGEFDSSIIYGEKALGIYKRNDYFQKVSSQLNQLSFYYKAIGTDSKTEDYLIESLFYANKSGSELMQFVVSNNLGEFYRIKNQHKKALKHHINALNILNNSGSATNIAMVKSKLASILTDTGRLESSIQLLNEVADIYKKLGKYRDSSSEYSSIAALELQRNDLNTSKKYFNKAAEYLEDGISNKSDTYFIERGRFHLAQGEYELAEDYANRTLEINKGLEYSMLRSYGYELKSWIRYKQGKYDQAVHFARLAYKNKRSDQYYQDVQVDMDMSLARALYKADNDSSFFYGLNTLKEVFNEDQTNKFKLLSGLNNMHRLHFNEIAGWYADQSNDLESSYYLTQYVKNESLKPLLNESKEVKSDKEKLVENLQINALTHLSESKNSKNAPDSLNLEYLSKELEYELGQKSNDKNKGVSQSFNKPHISISSLQKELDGKTAVIEFAFSNFGLLTFYITKSSAKAELQNGSHRYSKIHEYEEYVSTFNTGIKELNKKKELAKNSSKIYSKLLKQFFDENPQIENLIIIPDGPLSNLSFDALINNENRYLVEEYAIAYLPSTALIPVLKESKSSNSNKLFAYAASDFSGSDELIAGLRDTYYSPLPFTGVEVKKIGEKFDSKMVVKDDVYSEDLIKRTNLSDFEYVHFATHGVINNANPHFSKIILTNDIFDLGLTNDGHLTTIEIIELDLNSELVVLSACNTGNESYTMGNGILSLQKAFLYAGSNSVVASLWEVYDQSTPHFMDLFYSNLIESKQESWLKSTLSNIGKRDSGLFNYKSSSLREAKLSMLEHKQYSHPLYWGGFTYTGI